MIVSKFLDIIVLGGRGEYKVIAVYIELPLMLKLIPMLLAHRVRTAVVVGAPQRALPDVPAGPLDAGRLRNSALLDTHSTIY